jgi:hypothetical protein
VPNNLNRRNGLDIWIAVKMAMNISFLSLLLSGGLNEAAKTRA